MIYKEHSIGEDSSTDNSPVWQKHAHLPIYLILGLLISAVLSLPLFFADRFAAGVFIDGQDVSLLRYDQAQELLKQQTAATPLYSLTVVASDSAVSSTSAELGMHSNLNDVLAQGWSIGKSGSYMNKLSDIIVTVLSQHKLETRTQFDREKVHEFIRILQTQVEVSGKVPSALLSVSGDVSSLEIDPGSISTSLNKEMTYELIQTAALHHSTLVEAVLEHPSLPLTSEQIEAAKIRAQAFINKQLTFKAESSVFTLADTDLITLLQFPEGYKKQQLDQVIQDMTKVFNRQTSDAVFEYDPQTLAVSQFQPHQDGIELDSTMTYKQLLVSLDEIEKNSVSTVTTNEDTTALSVDAAIKVAHPNVTLADTNDLGIVQLIGKGQSQYAHSVANRVFNVSHTAKKITNYIIKPGEEYSFVKALGEVSNRTGFKSAYIIINGRTELGDGGGVCQVSTTLFRAVLDAGLKVTLRRPHSYRVSYYELDRKPGVDATVYAGEVDFRFVNDTDHHILIQAVTDDTNLHMEVNLYGTSDGRSTELVDHKTWGYQAAPPAEYYPDPSLPPGKLVKIDNAIPGINSSFSNVIYNQDGTVRRKDDYVSKYRPWAAKYRQGV